MEGNGGQHRFFFIETSRMAEAITLYAVSAGNIKLNRQ